MLRNLILKRRTIRKFKQKTIFLKILDDCIEAASLAPSAANLQPLEYIIVTKNLNQVFECTRWAGYIKDGTPKEQERPVAYIVVLSNSTINRDAKYDVGLAVENIVLTALEKGIASCIIGSLDREHLVSNLCIPGNYIVELVVALGYPKQKSKPEALKDNFKYWLDQKGVLHVPKRNFKNIIHNENF